MKIWYCKSQKKANDELLWRSLYLQLRKHTGPGDVTSALPTQGYVWKQLRHLVHVWSRGRLFPWCWVLLVGRAGTAHRGAGASLAAPPARCPLACAASCPVMGWLQETRKIGAPGAELQTPGFHVSQTWILACQKPRKKNWPYLQVVAKKFLLTHNIMNTCSQEPSKLSQTYA